MESKWIRVGEVIRERRELAGMTQKQLASATHSSLSLVQKIESGQREGQRRVLRQIFNTLGVYPVAQEYLLSLADHSREDQQKILTIESMTAQPHDLAVLTSLIHPACIVQPATLWLVAANRAFFETFPGVEHSGSLLYYHFLDARAKYVTVDWEAQGQVYAEVFRCLAPATLSREDRDEMQHRLNHSEEFRRMSDQQISPNKKREYISEITTRNPSTDAETEWYRNVTRMLCPHNRLNWYLTLHPKK